MRYHQRNLPRPFRLDDYRFAMLALSARCSGSWLCSGSDIRLDLIQHLPIYPLIHDIDGSVTRASMLSYIVVEVSLTV